MAKWFERAFDRTVDEAKSALAQARTELIEVGWFGRPAQRSEPGGWGRGVDEKASPGLSIELGWALPHNASHADKPSITPENDHEIDR